MNNWNWLIFIISGAITGGSLWYARIQTKRAKLAAQVDTFLSLRAAFSQVRANLTDEMFRPSNPAVTEAVLKDEGKRRAMLKYWYNAFDEWYVTQKLFPGELSLLWVQYYKEAVRDACKSDLMLCALAKAKEVSKIGVDGEFYEVVMELHDELNVAQSPKERQLSKIEGERVARWNQEHSDRLQRWNKAIEHT